MEDIKNLLIDLQVAYDHHVGEPNDRIAQESVAKMMRGLLTFHKIGNARIICDATNNPADVVDANDLVADLWIDKGDGTFFVKTFNTANSKVAAQFALLFGRCR